MAKRVTVCTTQVTPRVRYVFSLLLQDILGLEVTYVDTTTALPASTPKIHYSEETGEGVHVFPAGLLFQNDIFEPTLTTLEYEGYFAFFRVPVGDFPFDVFSASFYLASRYEEYLPHIADVHGRFKVESSLAFKHGFLRMPIVNFWAEKLGELLVQRYPDLQLSLPSFSFVSTVDVDNAFAFYGKGIFRTIGAIGKDMLALNFQQLFQRANTLLGLVKDPYNTWGYQLQMQQKYQYPAIYFILFAPFAKNDRNASPQSHAFQRYIKNVNDHAQVGLHPSYQSHEQDELPLKEKERLERVINQKITASRQHYLKMNLPKTLRQLHHMGITDDYSMGYAESPGFRASLCTPFRFYDLELETELPLRIHPLVMMDVTYIDYQRLSCKAAQEDILELLQMAKRFNGEFVSVWHNRTFSESEPEWKGWNSVYESMIAAACQ
ncbi:MAG: polysaccharide deacetylase family protein [Schleiferiaceae bacterium]|nr:polysaccharide deacetylase family protein [Schleiferiaceae bacterium]